MRTVSFELCVSTLTRSYDCVSAFATTAMERPSGNHSGRRYEVGEKERVRYRCGVLRVPTIFAPEPSAFATIKWYSVFTRFCDRNAILAPSGDQPGALHTCSINLRESPP